ncbi:MAG: hypothetical protein AB1489_15770 [Acidobacteriota bacterium]
MTTELLACPKCARNNSALRKNCIYCGEQLPVQESISAEAVVARAVKTRDIETKAGLDPLSQISSQLQQNLSGYNVVLVSYEAETEQVLSKLAGLTPFSEMELRQLLGYHCPFPLARFQYELEAKAIQEQLQTSGLQLMILSDEVLQAANPNRRIRRLQAIDGATITISAEGVQDSFHTIATQEIKLIVEGKIRYRQMQATEQNKGFGKTEREITNAVEFVDEQPLLDVYTLSLENSFRIRSESFDYSSLGNKMKLTTAENFRMLVATLRGAAAEAVYDSEFRQYVKLLELIWPSTSRNESLGLRRAQMLTAGKFATRSVFYYDNELQFNRYSRMRYNLLSTAKTKKSE